jgi:ribose 5-phosphate isomerase A
MSNTHNSQQDIWKQQVGEAAARLVREGMFIGLGTGSTANYFIRALGTRVRAGLRIGGAVASSQASHDLAASLGIPCTDLDTRPELDLYIDGADEIDFQLQLIKGAGGALLREKVVATAARQFIVIGDSTKQVSHLGRRFPVPVEIVPFAIAPIRKRLKALGAQVTLRQKATNTPFITENANIILDCTFPNGIDDAPDLDARIHSIIGVVETGLFLNIASRAIIAGPEGISYLPD